MQNKFQGKMFTFVLVATLIAGLALSVEAAKLPKEIQVQASTDSINGFNQAYQFLLVNHRARRV